MKCKNKIDYARKYRQIKGAPRKKKIMQEKQIEYAIKKKSDIELIKMAIINILPHRSNFDRFECSPLLLSRHSSISLTLY